MRRPGVILWEAATIFVILAAIVSPANIYDLVAKSFFLPSDVRPSEYLVRTTRTSSFMTSDGVFLAADIHAPIGPKKTPTILVRIPFNNSFKNRVRSDTIGRFWAKRGYTVVIQGARGRYRSGGNFYPAIHERKDGLETLAWLKTQPWFDGRLATWGGSAFGHTQWAISDLGEEGPDAFALQIASSNYYGTFYPGGAFALESALYWALVSPPEKDRKSNGGEIQTGAEGWPVIEADSRAFKDNAFFNDWATHRTKDAYWASIDGERRSEKVSAPMLLLGGWYDPFLPTMLDDFKSLTQNNPNALAHQSQIIIGPYVHAGTIKWPGADIKEDYRQASVQPVINWFDRWLEVRNTETETPPVRIFVMGDNIWRNEMEWPLARTKYTPFYFHEDGLLSQTPPSSTDFSLSFDYDPQSPVPTRGGAMLGPRSGIKLQDKLGARQDVLSFATPPLTQDIEVTGPLATTLHVSTDAPSTDFTVKLVDIHKNGQSYIISDGILRRLYSPGENEEIEVELNPTSVVFQAGHRLRVDISSSNFPKFDRNPNTGANSATATETKVARQTVFVSRDKASHIMLPIIPR